MSLRYISRHPVHPSPAVSRSFSWGIQPFESSAHGGQPAADEESSYRCELEPSTLMRSPPHDPSGTQRLVLPESSAMLQSH